ncbi:MAG TPA: helix-turn-helix domain-containing protein [Nocardioidaceae bacterium]|nr:helix-turn-helix domain-containing protein [Nocardioidaceae bacterium]
MPTELSPDDLLPIGTAAAIVGLSVDTLRRYETEGKITARRTPGNQRRFRRADVLALLDNPDQGAA